MYQRMYTVYEYNGDASGYLLTDFEGDKILDHLESSMRSGNYYNAASLFLEDCKRYALITVGGNYSSGDLHYSEKKVDMRISILGGMVCGGILTAILIAFHNRNAKTPAVSYSPAGAFRLKVNNDIFIKTTVSTRKIERSSGSSGSSGGRGFSGGGSGGGHGGSRGF